MVTMPIASGRVGGKPVKSSVIEKKTPAANENAASQISAAAILS